MATAENKLASRNLFLLFAGLVLAAAPHTERLPWWVNTWMALFFAWRMALVMNGGKLPHRAWLVMLALGGIAGVFITFRTVFGRDPGVTLLVMLAALKLLEMKGLRDVFVVVFLAYFMALTNFFYSQTIAMGVLMLTTVVAITASLVAFNDPEGRPKDTLRTATMLLLQASPLMLVLFFLFPRVSGPLWGSPQDAFTGVSGLSDSMSPGLLSRLSLSDSIAFRVKFLGREPNRRELYWRGPVFWRFDGKTWRGGNLRLGDERFDYRGNPIDYEVTLEPHNRNWMFALDLAASVPDNSRITRDYEMLAVAPVRNRMRYRVRSYTQYRAGAAADPSDLGVALRIPPVGNSRARELAEEWRRKAGPGMEKNAEIVRQALQFFRTGRYEYTLTPPLLGANPVDEFLFDARQGFCEHFSSAFAFLMRAAGVPSRVVTGYQGGEINAVDGYMVVRQSDAHAWDEVWLPESGWVRIDPTAAAAPLRLESGLAAAVPQTDELPLLIRANLGWLRSLRFEWEALTNQWNQWVLGYNFDRQREVLSFLGVRSPDWRALALLLFWSVAAVVGLTALWLFGRIRRIDPVQRAWIAFCRKLEHAGYARRPSEGPLDFGSRASGALPQRAETIAQIARLYAELRYGQTRSVEDASRLRSLVRTFTP